MKPSTSHRSDSLQRHAAAGRRPSYPNKLLVTILIWLLFCGRNASHSMDILIDPCKSDTYLTIDSLFDYCKIPGECGRKYECEGKTALIKGFIDYNNIFDKTTYPNLPYQKFLMTNFKRNQTIEVWVSSAGSDAIFKKIFMQKALDPDSMVFIRGVLAGFDMPIMGTCHRGLKLELAGDKSISFDVGGAESGNF